jgi:hypothetical protein
LVGPDFIGKTGKVSLAVEKDKTRKFPDRNVVRDYVVPKQGIEGLAFLQRRA